MEAELQSFLNRVLPKISSRSALAVIELAAEGATVPFIARYRKEKTNNLDEVEIRQILEAHENYNEVTKRKAFLLKEIGDQGNLTSEIKKRIEVSWDLGELEEIYRPFKKKKKTKATLAREAGLESLAQWLWDLAHDLVKEESGIEVKAKAYINPAYKINTYDEAIKGAQDILIEKIANDPGLRELVNKNYFEKAKLSSKAAKGFKPHSKYEMYKEFEESVKSLSESKNSHRYMAMRRGWLEEELTLEFKTDEAALLSTFEKHATTVPDTPVGVLLKNCAKTALQVYIIPSVSNEVHRHLKEASDKDAIRVFAENVRKLLLASPFGPRCVLGVDPGIRTGCKIALVDKGGNFISHTVIQTQGNDAEEKAKALFAEVIKKIKIDAIAVGNGTAGRQTEVFLRKILKELNSEIPVVMVNESGASVYSASEVARQEFPDLDITVRGAISIARRLQDPLAELVKIDPKSIGVGQYQHDVNQTFLKKSLDAVVESCVNSVGVDLNTASVQLLEHISGIGPALASNIVDYRKQKGLFSDREELLKVSKFSTKAYEQSAGFLRILNGKFILDSTGIHPERYQAIRDMAHEAGLSLTELVGESAKKLLPLRPKWIKLVGEYTFDDILKELEKPGRDPRDPFKVFHFREDIFEVKDLKEGMICPGIITNVTNFGAFVDIGVHQDGLVHISELSYEFVEDPRKIVNPGQQVKVKVLKVDFEKNQISLSLKLEAAPEMTIRNAESQRTRPKERRSDAKSPRPLQTKPTSTPLAKKADSQSRGASVNKQGHSQHHKQSHQRPSDNNKSVARTNKPFNNPFAALMNINDKK